MTKTATQKITVTPVRFGSWQSNATWSSVSDEVYFIPLDVQIMNIYDRLAVSSVPRGEWKMMATSNGGVYIYPNSKVKTVRMKSPNGHECEVSLETSGIIATLFAMSFASCRGNGHAGDAYHSIMEYLGIDRRDCHPEMDDILAMID